MYALGQQRTTVGDTVRSWPVIRQQDRSYRIRSHEYAMSMPTCTPPTANDALGRKWCRNPGVLAHARLAGDASPTCLAGHLVLRGGVGMEHMPKPDRHESIMTAALGRPARRPRASILTGRLPMHPAHCASTAGGLDSRPSYRRLTQPERCKARPTSRTPSAQAGDPLGTGVKNPKLDGPGGRRRTKPIRRDG